MKFLVTITTILTILYSADPLGNNSTIRKLEKYFTIELESIFDTYSEDNHGLIYDVIEEDAVRHQVVNRSLVTELKTEVDFGFTITLSFDDRFPVKVINAKDQKNRTLRRIYRLQMGRDSSLCK